MTNDLCPIQTFTPPASPGAGALGGLNATQQRTRGYSAIEGEEEQEGGAATPATQPRPSSSRTDHVHMYSYINCQCMYVKFMQQFNKSLGY